ncbi:MAG: hypothetical protein ACYDBH_23510 [Acidobacteriaceae bacterium]
MRDKPCTPWPALDAAWRAYIAAWWLRERIAAESDEIVGVATLRADRSRRPIGRKAVEPAAIRLRKTAGPFSEEAALARLDAALDAFDARVSAVLGRKA